MKLKENKPVGILKFHTKPITSVEWNLNDSTVFAASGEDNQLTIWDLAVEKDDEQIDGMRFFVNSRHFEIAPRKSLLEF
jgi:WD40 repeat protein